jgi:hypothetical protein
MDSVAEADELSSSAADFAQSSPARKPTTPSSRVPVKLPKSEMHPSKVHQTMAPPSSGLRNGFVDIDQDPTSREQPSGITQSTPSKSHVPSSNFTFRVDRPGGESTLGPEAQRMMEDLREQAAKIKAELAAKREQERLEEMAEFGGRKFAKAKGKAGRFSDVHMAEFKKMDSIENHPSVLRAAADRFSPMKAGLKRSRSKVDINDAEHATPKKTLFAKKASESPGKRQRGEELESPAKRFRQRVEDDISTYRPVSRDDSSIPRPKSSGQDSIRGAIPKSRTFEHLMSPTKASAARSALIKSPSIPLPTTPSKTENSILARSPSKPSIGSLVRSPSKLQKSPSKPSLNSLRMPKTYPSWAPESSTSSLVQTPGRFGRVKSILKRQFSTSKPKSNIPQLTCPRTPSSKEQESHAVPLTTPGQKFGRRVEFTPDTKQAAETQNSPSPIKSIISRLKPISKVPALAYPSVRDVRNLNKSLGDISYPDLSAYGVDTVVDKNEEETEAAKPAPLPKSVPGTFTFRSDKTINFDSVSPQGFGGAAGQASLRHVRKSATAAMPGSFPSCNDAPSSPNKENKDPGRIFAIPHGLSNKKRHVAGWDDGEIMNGIPHGMPNKKRHLAKDEEGILDGIAHGVSNKKRHRASSADHEEDDEGAQRGAKKLRKHHFNAELDGLSATPRLAESSPIKRLMGTPSPQKRKGLTLSRLNMLARPKNRQ